MQKSSNTLDFQHSIFWIFSLGITLMHYICIQIPKQELHSYSLASILSLS